MPRGIAIFSVLPSKFYYDFFKDTSFVKLKMWIVICKTSISEVGGHRALQPTWHSEEKSS